MVKSTLSFDTVSDAMRREFTSVTGFAPLVEGEQSQAFGFDAAEGPLVVRVNHRPDAFDLDVFASRHFGAAELPVPEVVRTGRVDQEHVYCVSRRVPGNIIQDCDSAALERLRAPVSSVLAAIAAADVSATTGYGSFDGEGVGRHKSWAEAILHWSELDWTDCPAEIDRAAVEQLNTELRRLAERLPEQRQLIHGDFGSNNLMVAGDRVTGVLDWEAAMIGDGLYDLATLAFWSPFLECMRVQADHELAKLDGGASERLRCYVISLGLRSIHYYAAASRIPIAQAMVFRTMKELRS